MKYLGLALTVLVLLLSLGCGHSFSDRDIKQVEDDIKAEYDAKSNIQVLSIHMQRQTSQELVGFTTVVASNAFGIESYKTCIKAFPNLVSSCATDSRLQTLNINCVAKMDRESGKSFWRCGE